MFWAMRITTDRPPVVLRRFTTTCVTLAAAAALGCSSTSAPKPLPTLRVINTSCAVGDCRTIEIRAFLWTVPVPEPFWGLRVVGEVHTADDCLTFPASWTLRVISPTDTQTYVWTPRQEIFLIAVDSAAFHSQGNPDFLRAATSTFAPADSPGWRVTLPSAEGTSTLEASESCVSIRR